MKNNDELYFQLRVRRDLWERFEATVPRNITLNDAVLNLIRKEVR